jgi:hypothetical protein
MNFLKAKNICPNAIELGAHYGDALGKCRLSPSYIIQVFEIEGCDSKRHGRLRWQAEGDFDGERRADTEAAGP